MLQRDSEREKDLPRVTQQCRPRAGIRTPPPVVWGYGMNRGFQICRPGIIGRKRMLITSAGTARGPRAERARTRTRTAPPSQACAWSWRLSCFRFVPRGQSRAMLPLPQAGAPPTTPSQPVSAGWETSAHPPPAPGALESFRGLILVPAPQGAQGECWQPRVPVRPLPWVAGASVPSETPRGWRIPPSVKWGQTHLCPKAMEGITQEGLRSTCH